MKRTDRRIQTAVDIITGTDGSPAARNDLPRLENMAKATARYQTIPGLVIRNANRQQDKPLNQRWHDLGAVTITATDLVHSYGIPLLATAVGLGVDESERAVILLGSSCNPTGRHVLVEPTELITQGAAMPLVGSNQLVELDHIRKLIADL